MNEVIEGLKRVEVRMIGICGMGGVGKTTMVKEIITRLAKLNLFDKIVMAIVSQSPSIRTIQSEIADEIGLEFKVESESGRARKLHERLMEIKRILIVLDDVWTEPNFEAIGLPYGDTHKGCKILLTSRDSEVCNRMGSQQIIAVPTLTTEESQELFREMVGESFNDPDLRSTAEDVVKECGGLPIAIVTVGKALEKKNKHEWDDALNQLRNSRPENIPGVNDKVYSCIKWSYDRLESDEARSCLLLCCLFPEDYDISIEYLVRYGWGRGYFSSIVTLEDARNRVHSLVYQLKRRFLLLDSYVSEATKMHDVVRDVAISIASRDPHGFLISNAENKRWPNLATYDHYTTISLVGKLEIPVGLKCPKLELLQKMKGRFSEGSMDIISDTMKELKVLALVEMKDLGSSRSLGVLKNLRTLCLDRSKIDGMSTDVIGSLENLEILSFRGCVSLHELPREIGRLKQLRLLDTTDCRNLEVIPHGIFSSLCRLEELYMLNSFTKWEIGRGREDKGMASISEVMSLSDHLKMTIYAFENCLVIDESDAKELESQAVRLLLKKSKKLILSNVKNFRVLTYLDQEGFQDLKILLVLNCPNTEYLANGTSVTQQKLFPLIQSVSQLADSFLSNLRFLKLADCGNNAKG
ncbi:disease resistance protein At4g27190-like [Malus sylvestris]|uniref:disease resistance protein At4g27190-like n=1 Tax=Malus sylvestris TaxID=3752 RepID=UPI0021ACCBBB|nr:disease resistance protein At4g27190-like [Malus sylvestris]